MTHLIFFLIDLLNILLFIYIQFIKTRYFDFFLVPHEIQHNKNIYIEFIVKYEYLI